MHTRPEGGYGFWLYRYIGIYERGNSIFLKKIKQGLQKIEAQV
jgi:hypothetical protein